MKECEEEKYQNRKEMKLNRCLVHETRIESLSFQVKSTDLDRHIAGPRVTVMRLWLRIRKTLVLLRISPVSWKGLNIKPGEPAVASLFLQGYTSPKAGSMLILFLLHNTREGVGPDC